VEHINLIHHIQNIDPMKKTAVIIFLVVMLATIFASCRTHELCPAYSKANKAKTEKRA